MKVILLRDVARIGKKGTIAQVPDGYAMNQLIPSRSAEPATPQNLRKAERLLKDKADKVEADSNAFTEVVSKISALDKLEIVSSANEKNHLFKAISADDVKVALETAGVSVGAFEIAFTEPVKEVGEHKAQLVHADTSHTFGFTVVAK